MAQLICTKSYESFRTLPLIAQILHLGHRTLGFIHYDDLFTLSK